MVIGFKTGPKNWEVAKTLVVEDGARMCEVWFNIGKAEEYQDMFTWLQQHDVMIGLHHWGVVDGNIKTNLATQNEHVRGESLAQMKQAVDMGREIGAVYINVHPGARWLETNNLETGEQSLVPHSEAPRDISERFLLEAARELRTYGQRQEVLVTIETLPGREARHYPRQEGMYDSGNPSLSLMKKIGEEGGFIANDITHSASMIATADNSRDGMWEQLREFTRSVAPYTRLIHVNTMREPFNGLDSHDGLLPSDFAQGVFPNREQLKELLALFPGRRQVYAVAEPHIEVTRENYLALKKIAEEAGVALG